LPADARAHQLRTVQANAHPSLDVVKGTTLASQLEMTGYFVDGDRDSCCRYISVSGLYHDEVFRCHGIRNVDVVALISTVLRQV